MTNQIIEKLREQANREFHNLALTIARGPDGSLDAAIITNPKFEVHVANVLALSGKTLDELAAAVDEMGVKNHA